MYLASPRHMNTVIESFMPSLALDIFGMEPKVWLGVSYDCILLCGDRTSSWIIALPTTKLGLTGEKAALLQLESSWGEMPPTSLIKSDQGVQFVSQWWRTMCAILGVSQAFSQARRPQANGRAETAGKTLRTILRKMNSDKPINWFEALPCLLKIIHDLINPIVGLSPYQMFSGMERPLGGLPTKIEIRCPSADASMDHMAELDQSISKTQNEELEKQENKINKNLNRSEEFSQVTGSGSSVLK